MYINFSLDLIKARNFPPSNDPTSLRHECFYEKFSRQLFSCLHQKWRIVRARTMAFSTSERHGTDESMTVTRHVLLLLSDSCSHDNCSNPPLIKCSGNFHRPSLYPLHIINYLEYSQPSLLFQPPRLFETQEYLNNFFMFLSL